ncbi:MAG: cytidylyltransferase domain-containing protein [Brevinema sp.]
MLKKKLNSQKTLCAVQTRLNSSRFPQKCFALLAGKPLLQHVLERCLLMDVKKCVLLVPQAEKSTFEDFIKHINFPVDVFGGNENNVLQRYHDATHFFSWQDNIMRVTGDNPLISVFLANQLIQNYQNKGISHYLGNPLGTGVELFTASELNFVSQNAIDPYEQEHVTPFFYRHPEIFHVDEPISPVISPLKSVTVDVPADLQRVEQILSLSPQWGINDFFLPQSFTDF